MTLFHTRTRGMTRTELDVSKLDLPRGTTGSTLLVTTIYQPSPLVSIAGPDLSTTLIDLANIQSRSLDLMVANQKSQQDVYNELTRANKDKANKAMFTTIDTYDGVDRSKFEEWIDKLDQVCQISSPNFSIEIIKNQ